MTDILQGTLSGTTTGMTAPQTPNALIMPNTSGNNLGKNISKLQAAQQKPEALLDLQKAMTLASQTAYRKRQEQELTMAGNQTDFSAVSGGTFASVIGALEQQRGGDISRIYQSTMGTYQSVQQQITQRLQYMQELEESRRRWEAEMEMREEEFEYIKEKDEEAADRLKEQLEEDKRRFELEWNYKMSRANTEVATYGIYPSFDTNRAQYESLIGGQSTNQPSFDIDSYLGINK